MPNMDGTGPQGKGPKTGRELGECQDANPRVGRGRGMGFGGFGRGCRFGFGRGMGFRRQISLSKEEEKRILEEELNELDLDKKEIEKRIEELK